MPELSEEPSKCSVWEGGARALSPCPHFTDRKTKALKKNCPGHARPACAPTLSLPPLATSVRPRDAVSLSECFRGWAQLPLACLPLLRPHPPPAATWSEGACGAMARKAVTPCSLPKNRSGPWGRRCWGGQRGWVPRNSNNRYPSPPPQVPAARVSVHVGPGCLPAVCPGLSEA